MKNKKGFTLVEFFALIGVVALIAAIVSPFVIKGMENSKKKAFISKVDELLEAARKVSPDEERVITILNHEYTSADNLVVNKDLPLAATIKINQENQISIVAQNKDWCIKKDYDDAEYTVTEYTGKCNIAKSVTFAGQTVDIKETDSNQDGLYLDTAKTSVNSELPYSSKYYYRGSNPNNYVVLDKKCYRIINVAQNDTLKIVYEGNADSKGRCTEVSTAKSGSIGKTAWDTDENITEAGTWANNSKTIRTILDNATRTLTLTGSSKTIELKNIEANIIKADFYVGKVNYNKYDKQTLAKDVEQERVDSEGNVQSYNSLVGLLNISDYVKAAISDACQAAGDAMGGSQSCSQNNYLYKANYKFWTINPTNKGTFMWVVNNKGILSSNEANDSSAAVRPVLYLNNEVVLKGKGTETEPYKIVEVKEEIEDTETEDK